MGAVIKNYHGTPTLFLDGKPTFYGLMWAGTPEEGDRYRTKQNARYYSEAGVHIYIWHMGVPNEWCGPRPGKEGNYNFEIIEKAFKNIIEI